MEEIETNFSKIYDQYVPKIYRFIYLKIGIQETTEDLCSEVFMRIWKAMKAKGIQNIQAFLYQVARNVVADHYRQKGRFQFLSIEATEEIEDSADSISESIGKNIEMERVQKALFQLQENHQNLIIWYYLDELSVPEIAQITQKSEGNVRVGIHRSLRALKNQLNLPKV